MKGIRTTTTTSTASGVLPNKPSRKELLAQYRQSKDPNKENVNAGVQRGKEEMKIDLKSKMKKATSTTIAPAKQMKRNANQEKIELAGREKIAPTTPIGKLKRRLQSTQYEFEENGQSISVPKKTLEDLNQKLLEAKLLTQSHSTKIARTFLENLKTQEGYEWIISKAIYWLACIKLEIRDRKWERVEQLFSLADGALEDASDRSALAAAYEDFKESTETALKEKLKVVQSSLPLPSSQSGELVQTREAEPPQNPFQNVSVASIRSMFEKNAETGADLPCAPTRNMRVDLPMGKPLDKKLVGGVPLIGLASTNTSIPRSTPQKLDPERERNLELLLLGIGPFEDATNESPARDHVVTPETNKRKMCAMPRSDAVRLGSENDEDEKETVPKRTCTTNEEAGSSKLQVKKSLRFDSVESEPNKGQTSRIKRKGTPYKYTRRTLVEED